MKGRSAATRERHILQVKQQNSNNGCALGTIPSSRRFIAPKPSEDADKSPALDQSWDLPVYIRGSPVIISRTTCQTHTLHCCDSTLQIQTVHTYNQYLAVTAQVPSAVSNNLSCVCQLTSKIRAAWSPAKATMGISNQLPGAPALSGKPLRIKSPDHLSIVCRFNSGAPCNTYTGY